MTNQPASKLGCIIPQGQQVTYQPDLSTCLKLTGWQSQLTNVPSVSSKNARG